MIVVWKLPKYTSRLSQTRLTYQKRASICFLAWVLTSECRQKSAGGLVLEFLRGSIPHTGTRGRLKFCSPPFGGNPCEISRGPSLVWVFNPHRDHLWDFRRGPTFLHSLALGILQWLIWVYTCVVIHLSISNSTSDRPEFISAVCSRTINPLRTIPCTQKRKQLNIKGCATSSHKVTMSLLFRLPITRDNNSSCPPQLNINRVLPHPPIKFYSALDLWRESAPSFATPPSSPSPSSLSTTPHALSTTWFTTATEKGLKTWPPPPITQDQSPFQNRKGVTAPQSLGSPL